MLKDHQQYDLKTPSQALKLLKEDLKEHPKFQSITKKGFINTDRFYKSAYELIKDNFKVTNKIFILEEQVEILVNNEVNLSVSEAMATLLDVGLLDVMGVNEQGQLTYKLSDLGSRVADYLKEYDEEDKTI